MPFCKQTSAVTSRRRADQSLYCTHHREYRLSYWSKPGQQQGQSVPDVIFLETSASLAYAVITVAIRLRHDYDASRAPASIRREQKMNMSIFRRSRVVVASQSNRTQVVISITSVVVDCVVVSSYRSRIVVESQL